MDKLKVDCFGVVETDFQWDMAQKSLIKILNLKKGSRTAYARNKNERTNEKQRSGTCITMKEQY